MKKWAIREVQPVDQGGMLIVAAKFSQLLRNPHWPIFKVVTGYLAFQDYHLLYRLVQVSCKCSQFCMYLENCEHCTRSHEYRVNQKSSGSSPQALYECWVEIKGGPYLLQSPECSLQRILNFPGTPTFIILSHPHSNPRKQSRWS